MPHEQSIAHQALQLFYFLFTFACSSCEGTFRCTIDGCVDESGVGHAGKVVLQLLEETRNWFHKNLPVIIKVPQVDQERIIGIVHGVGPNLHLHIAGRLTVLIVLINSVDHIQLKELR